MKKIACITLLAILAAACLMAQTNNSLAFTSAAGYSCTVTKISANPSATPPVAASVGFTCTYKGSAVRADSWTPSSTLPFPQQGCSIIGDAVAIATWQSATSPMLFQLGQASTLTTTGSTVSVTPVVSGSVAFP